MPILSGYPLYGLVHRIDIIRRADTDDGSGGVIPGTPSAIYSSLPARVTVMSGEDEQKVFGNASGNKWRVISKYALNIHKSDFLSLSANSVAAPIDAGLEYRVLWVKHQIDDVGRFHHTSLVVELED